MLRTIECEGYKAFRRPTRVDLRRITVIFGRNNSGKTTLARLPLFITASLNENEGLYVLSSGGVRFGSSFVDLASVDQPHPRIFFGISWDPGCRLSADLQYVTSPDQGGSVQPVSLRIDDSVSPHLKLQPARTQPTYRLLLNSLSVDGRKRLDKHRKYLQEVLNGTLHIPSARPRIKGTYTVRDPTSWMAEEVPYLLARHRNLLRVVGGWFQTSLDGTRIDIDQAAFAFRLAEETHRLVVNLTDSGRGTQSVLPVATLLLGVATEQKRARLVIVEEPEAHLHPSAHGAVADLIIQCSEKSQVVIETHSENLILRLRRRIAEGRIKVDDMALYYVDESHNVKKIVLDSYGAASNWPSGVFENDVEEAHAIVEAKMSTISGLGEP